jgi:hypothetical protein
MERPAYIKSIFVCRYSSRFYTAYRAENKLLRMSLLRMSVAAQPLISSWLHTWKWRRSSALSSPSIFFKLEASGLSRKNSSQKPSDFSTSSSS